MVAGACYLLIYQMYAWYDIASKVSSELAGAGETAGALFTMTRA
jgi:hypothetical protein